VHGEESDESSHAPTQTSGETSPLTVAVWSAHHWPHDTLPSAFPDFEEPPDAYGRMLISHTVTVLRVVQTVSLSDHIGVKSSHNVWEGCPLTRTPHPSVPMAMMASRVVGIAGVSTRGGSARDGPIAGALASSQW
jgi:hypothetical protein